ncbi:hypothetical protein Tco_0080152 [Tanacetum coccineum]
MVSIRSMSFNGVDYSDRKISWVAWVIVFSCPNRTVVLVFEFLSVESLLLLKWVWRFISGDGSLWCKVIQAIYGSKFDLYLNALFVFLVSPFVCSELDKEIVVAIKMGGATWDSRREIGELMVKLNQKLYDDCFSLRRMLQRDGVEIHLYIKEGCFVGLPWCPLSKDAMEMFCMFSIDVTWLEFVLRKI